MGLELGCGRGDTRQLFRMKCNIEGQSCHVHIVSLFLSHFVSIFFDCSVLFQFLSMGLGRLSLPPSVTESHGQDGWKDGRRFLERWYRLFADDVYG